MHVLGLVCVGGGASLAGNRITSDSARLFLKNKVDTRQRATFEIFEK